MYTYAPRNHCYSALSETPQLELKRKKGGEGGEMGRGCGNPREVSWLQHMANNMNWISMCLPMLQPTHIHAHHHFNLMYCYLISHVCTFNFSAMRKKNLNHLYFFVCLFVFSFIFMILWCLFFFYYLFLIKRNRFSVFACLSLFYLYKTSKMDSSVSTEEDIKNIKNINNRLWKKTHRISILILLLYHKFSQSVSMHLIVTADTNYSPSV